MKRLALIAASAVLPLGIAMPSGFGPELRSSCADLDSIPQSVAVMILPPDEIRDLANKRAESRGERYKGRVLAFQSVHDLGDGKFTNLLVVPPLRGQDDKEVLALWGHELAHAVCGNWHD